jgi:hypothetical protein
MGLTYVCPLKAETGLKRREDLIEVTTTLVDRDQIVEFLLGEEISGFKQREVYWSLRHER